MTPLDDLKMFGITLRTHVRVEIDDNTEDTSNCSD